jgi:epoxyqueuosine reductase QueG
MGISILRKLEDAVVDGIGLGPTFAYLDHYHQVNRELNECVQSIAASLEHAGFPSLAIPATVDDQKIQQQLLSTLSYPVSHKLVATRAGLGFVGKTDLLVSKRFGPRTRLASILTQAPLEVADPINQSQCGTCSVCVKTCPAEAANGKSWQAGMAREEFFDAFKCRAYCRQISQEKLQEDISLCGLCVHVCPMGKS